MSIWVKPLQGVDTDNKMPHKQSQLSLTHDLVLFYKLYVFNAHAYQDQMGFNGSLLMEKGS